jgi:hypothetical protein
MALLGLCARPFLRTFRIFAHSSYLAIPDTGSWLTRSPMRKNNYPSVRLSIIATITLVLLISSTFAFTSVGASVFTAISPGIGSSMSAWWTPAAPAAQAASVSTDKDDYVPGQTVYISGSGFLAGENVQLQIVHIDATVALRSIEADHSGHDRGPLLRIRLETSRRPGSCRKIPADRPCS